LRDSTCLKIKVLPNVRLLAQFGTQYATLSSTTNKQHTL